MAIHPPDSRPATNSMFPRVDQEPDHVSVILSPNHTITIWPLLLALLPGREGAKPSLYELKGTFNSGKEWLEGEVLHVCVFVL